ncbi:ATP-binding region, ATPase-like domain protein, partial [mine drainage metagenome]
SEDEGVLATHREAVASIRQILVSVVVQLRQLADGLRPPLLDDLGLVASLRQLVADFSGRSETKGSLRVSGAELDLGWDRKTDIYRIVQEALRNVERHAGASHVEVHLSFAKRTVRVKVQDDGCGFLVDTTVPGLGLRGMSERATLAKGRLEVNSVLGQGTTVRLTMS